MKFKDTLDPHIFEMFERNIKEYDIINVVSSCFPDGAENAECEEVAGLIVGLLQSIMDLYLSLAKTKKEKDELKELLEAVCDDKYNDSFMAGVSGSADNDEGV